MRRPTSSRSASTCKAGGTAGSACSANDLEINSSTAGFASGRLYAEAGGSIFITETENELVVLAAKSLTGDVRLTVPDTNGDPRPAVPDRPESTQRHAEDLILAACGTASQVTRSRERRRRSQRRRRLRRAARAAASGRSATSPSGSATTSTRPRRTEIVAGGTIYIHGDANRSQHAPTRPTPTARTSRTTPTHSALDAGGCGTNMHFAGRLGGVFDRLGGTGDRTDRPDADLRPRRRRPLRLRRDTPRREDPRLRQPEPSAIDDTLHAAAARRVRRRRGPVPRRPPADDGRSPRRTRSRSTARQGTDTYRDLHRRQPRRRPATTSINVLDTGAPNDGVDVATVVGTDGADIFLLRRVTSIAPGPDDCATRAPRSAAFVALLHGDVDGAARHHRASTGIVGTGLGRAHQLRRRAQRPAHRRRPRRQRPLRRRRQQRDHDARRRRRQRQVPDRPDLRAQRDADARLAADRRLPDAHRDDPRLPEPGHQRAARRRRAATGNDQFTVYSNQAELRLEGDDGNDLFIVRAFALAETDAGRATIQTRRPGADAAPMPQTTGGFSTAGRLDIRTRRRRRRGAVQHERAGLDRRRRRLRQGRRARHRVRRRHRRSPTTAIYGAGVNVRYATVEVVEVDGLEGDDQFFVQSTAVRRLVPRHRRARQRHDQRRRRRHRRHRQSASSRARAAPINHLVTSTATPATTACSRRASTTTSRPRPAAAS